MNERNDAEKTRPCGSMICEALFAGVDDFADVFENWQIVNCQAVIRISNTLNLSC